MNIIYAKAAHFDEEMKSGIMREKYGEIHIDAKTIDVLIYALNEKFKTNLNTKGQSFDDLDLIIWTSENEKNVKSLQIDVNERYPGHQRFVLIKQIIGILEKNSDMIQQVRITRNCEIDASLVEQLLLNIKGGDVFENIIENIPKLCFIDSETYQRHENIAKMIDEFEEILFQEILNKKIKVNGQGGILRQVKGFWGRYGFYETGVKKNYVSLSLVQKMGTRTVRAFSMYTN